MAMIYFLGTGSAFPSSERDNTSFLFSYDDKNILVDVSGNPVRRLKEINKSSREIDSILLTHIHIDHIYGLPSLLWGMWLEHRTEPLFIYTEKQNEEQLKRWMDTIQIDEWGIQFDIQIIPFNGGEPSVIIQTDDIKVGTFPAKHSIPTVGYEFIYKEKRIVYSADTEINEHLNEYNYIDILIHEATTAQNITKFHSSMEEVLTKYELEKIEKIIFVHLSDYEPYDKVYKTFEKNNKKNSILIAYDQMKITV